MKTATPRRRHVTEMKCIPQIMYMAIDKRLELQNCAWSVSMWFQYGVKPLCAAIRVSMRRGVESKRPWISSWGISLHTVCMRVHKASRAGAGGLLTNKLPTNHIPDMFDGQHVWQTCRLGKQWYPSSLEEGLRNPCHVWPSIVLLKYGVAWRRGSTSGCKTSLI